jgi:regulation of enolase protein 1 (concanavalin A-like superfamily)
MENNLTVLEDFKEKEFNKGFKWFSPPKEWFINIEKSQLVIKADKETDFWQKTHYGFEADNGHFLYFEVKGNFRISTKVNSYPVNRYDQAGLMVRFSKDTWIKSSVEYIPDSKSKLGAVVTNNGYSDWSTQEVENEEAPMYFRISRINNDFYVDHSLDGIEWNQIRMTHLFEKESKPVLVGIYTCSPQAEGYEAHFDFIKIETITTDSTQVYF